MNSWLKKAGNWLGSDSIGQSLGFSSGISNADLLLGADQLGGQLFGVLAGQNETTVGNVMKNIPGLSTVGNLINAAFGSHINDEFVTQTRYATNALGNRTFNFNTNADVLNDWKNYSDLSFVRQSDVGSDGWFSSDAEDTTDDLNAGIRSANKRQRANFYLSAQNADQNTDFRILQGMQAAYGGPINSFRKYYSKGGYLNQAKALIRQNEGWREKPYADAPRGKNWRSVGYGFNDSGFREKYPEGISKHYEHGITKKQAEEELDYFLSKAEKQLKSIYGKQWNEFTDSQKAAILDTYYQRPASVGKSSRFYKAVTAGEDAGRYLGVAGFDKRNKIRQGVFGGSQDYVNLGAETENPSTNSSSLQEVTPFTPVVHELDLSGITPTQAKALELNLASPTFDLSMFGSVPTKQESYVPTVGTVEDFLASYGNFDDMLFAQGGFLWRELQTNPERVMAETRIFDGELNNDNMNKFNFGGGITHGANWDTGINWVDEGSSHEENPHGGVPMGVDEQGIPNLVEEGEAIWNGDYVFSKRMKVPKKLAQKYGLGGDLTFADAIAKLTKNSEERPLSNIDRATNDHILGEFADSQEELRMAKAQRAMDKEVQLQDDFLTGFQFGFGGHMSPMGIVPDSDNISLFDKLENSFEDGGGIHIDPSKKGTFKAQASKMGMGVQEAASHILAHKENYSPAMVKKANFARNFAHAFGGSLFENPFAYGGELGNVFAGKGDRPQVLYLDDSNPSLLRRVFGDNGFTRFMENAATAINDPLGYFAGNEIDAIMNKVAQMSEPQLEKFFSTSVGQAVAKAIDAASSGNNLGTSAQQAGVQRWMRATGRLAKPVQRAITTAAKKAVAQSKINARGQMKTSSGGGKPTRVTETKTPAQVAKENMPSVKAQRDARFPAVRGSSEVAPFNSQTTLATRGTTDLTPFASGNTGVVRYTGNDKQWTWWPLASLAATGAGGLLDWALSSSDEPEEVDGVTGAARVNRPSDETGGVVGTGTNKSNRFLSENKGTSKRRNKNGAAGAVVPPIVPTGEMPSLYTEPKSIVEMANPATAKSEPTPEQGLELFDPKIMGNTDAMASGTRVVTIDPNGTKVTRVLGRPQIKPKQTWMRNLPWMMSGIFGLNEMLTPADYSNADAITKAAYEVGTPVSIGTEYIGDYRKRNPFDERYLENIINQRGTTTNRNFMNLSGGNRAVEMSGILANDLTTQMSLAEAARQAYLANREDDAKVTEFNRGTNLFNAQTQNQRNQFLAQLNSQRQQAMLSGVAQGARMRQAIKDQRDAAISANWTAFAQGLGDIGWENYQTNQVNSLYNQGYTPYWINMTGNTNFGGRYNG